jgi:hypothetical protein
MPQEIMAQVVPPFRIHRKRVIDVDVITVGGTRSLDPGHLAEFFGQAVSIAPGPFIKVIDSLELAQPDGRLKVR